MLPNELFDLIIYFTKNPVAKLSLVNKYFNHQVRRIRITSNKNYPNIKDEHLSQLPNLVELDLGEYYGFAAGQSKKQYSNNRKDITDNGLSNLTNLTKLNLSYNNTITDKGLYNLSNLTSLCLHGNTKVTNKSLSNLPNLINLDLSECESILSFEIGEICPKLYQLIQHNGKAKLFAKNLRSY